MDSMFKFSTEITVGIGDINYGGHLSNDKYLVIFQEARLRYLQRFGFSEMDIGDKTSLIMSEAQVKYRAEAFWNEKLRIFVRVTGLDKSRFTFEYMISKRGEKDVVVATGTTKMVAFDYQNRKVRRLPEIFVTKISEFEKHAK